MSVTIGCVETYTDTIERAHRTLGLRVFASPDEIKKAWRVRARETHPDHGGSAKAFRDVQTAAQFLLAEGAREHYRAEARATAASRATTYAPPPPPPPPPVRPTPAAPHSVRSRSRVHRRPALLIGAMFGFVIAPHLRELGLAWDPLPFHDFCSAMHSLDWVFLGAWWWLKKPEAR